MEQHVRSVTAVAAAVSRLYEAGQPYRVVHGSSNSTRPRHGPDQHTINISGLNRVLSIDRVRKTCLVEPNVPMDKLAEATMAVGLVPPVVMDFPGITAGGGFSGTSAESSSFRHGFFDHTVNWVEMVLGNGDIVRASRHERGDLFRSAAGAVGTLGTVTLLELRLTEAKTYVHVTYQKVDSVSMAISKIQSRSALLEADYMDGILYARDHGVVITGTMTNDKPPERPVQTFSNAADPWFYLHVQQRTKDLPSLASVSEFIPLAEYLFRYDRAGFWVGRAGYTYFKIIPFNAFFRWLLDDFSHTRTLYHALHASRISSQFVVQDVALPYGAAEEFIGWTQKELDIWPLWLCPLAASPCPTFHPVTMRGTTNTATTPVCSPAANGTEDGSIKESHSQPMLNVGVWGWGPQDYKMFISKNRALEKLVARLGGRKWLYSHSYYEQGEFWDLYGQSWYRALRKRYFATSLPTVYDKVKVDAGARVWQDKDWRLSWMSRWPIGGVYGMLVAALSGDIYLHRAAKWRYKRQSAYERLALRYGKVALLVLILLSLWMAYAGC